MVRVKSQKRAEWEPVVRRLHALGLSDAQIAERMGIYRQLACRRRVDLGLPTNPYPCRHCGRLHRQCVHKFGLCHACYQDRDIRQRYRQSSSWAGVGLTGTGKLPEQPTDAVPGSLDKMAVLAARAERGDNLFHPRDRRADLR